MKSPLAALEAFMAAWARRDWHRMLAVLQVRRRTRTTETKLRLQLGYKHVSKWEVLAIGPATLGARTRLADDSTQGIQPEMWIARVRIVYRIGRALFARVIVVNIIREDEHGQPVAATVPAVWGVNEISAIREEPVGVGSGDQP